MSVNRFELPSAAGAMCELRLEGSSAPVEVLFFSADGQPLGSKTFPSPSSVTEDDLVDFLASSDVQFVTFSALYDASELILQQIKEASGEDSSAPSPEPIHEDVSPAVPPLEEDSTSDHVDDPTPSIDDEAGEEVGGVVEEPLPELTESEVSFPFDTDGLGSLLRSVTVPYTQDMLFHVFQPAVGSFALVVEDAGREVYRQSFDSSPSEDDIFELIQASGVSDKFVSMSVTFDVTDLVLQACQGASVSPPPTEQAGEGTTGPAVEEPPLTDGLAEEGYIPDLPDVEPLSFSTAGLGSLVRRIAIPEAEEAFVFVFQPSDSSFSLVFEVGGQEVHRCSLPDDVSDDDVLGAIQAAAVPVVFDSMTVQFEVADRVVNTCKTPADFSSDLPEGLVERVEASRGVPAASSSAPSAAEGSASTTVSPGLAAREPGVEKVASVGQLDEETLLTTFEVPYSNSSIAFYGQNTGSTTLVFKVDGKEVYRAVVTGVPSEDDAYKLVEDSTINKTFSSMSLIFDVSEKIVEVCGNHRQFMPQLEEEEEGAETPEQYETVEVEEEGGQGEEAPTGPLPRPIINEGRHLTTIKIPYSHDTTCKVFAEMAGDEPTGNFALAFWRDDKEVGAVAVTSALDDDGAVEVLNSVDISFISMSVIYDAAEDIVAVVQDPSPFLVSEEEDSGEGIASVGYGAEEEEEEPIDFDQFRRPEDIEPLLAAIKKSLLKANTPLLVKESSIPNMKNVGFKVFRQGEDKWSMDFVDTKTGELLTQRPAKLKEVSFEEVFKAVNNGIPQISLSAVNDASEYVFDVVKHLAERPADDLAFNQVITHFEKVILAHEQAGESDHAIELTKGLQSKLEDLSNASGVAQFGLKLARFYEAEERFADSARHRLETIPKLVELGDLQSLREFVDDTINLFAKDLNRPIDAAQVSVDFGEVVLRRKDLPLAMTYVRQASAYYKQANIPMALSNHNYRFGKLFLQLLRGDEPEGFFDEPTPTASPSGDAEEGEGSELSEDLLDLADDDDPFADLEDEVTEGSAEGLGEEELVDKLAQLDEQPDDEEGVEEEVLPEPTDLYDLRDEGVTQILEDIVELFRDAMDIFSEAQSKAELVDALTEVILMFRRYKFLDQEVIFAERGVEALKDNGQPDRALRLSIQMVDKLMVEGGNYEKGLEFFNIAVKLYYEKNDFANALDLSMRTVTKLVKLADKDTSLQYVGFLVGLTDKVYPEPCEEALVEYLRTAELYQELKKSTEAIQMLAKAIIFKRNNLEDLLVFCHEHTVRFLKEKNVNLARDFINSAIQYVGGENLESVIRVSEQFSADLVQFRYFEMAMQYLTYAYQIAQNTPDALQRAGWLVVEATKRFTAIDDLPTPRTYFNPLLPILKVYFTQTQQFGLAVEVLEPVVDKFLDNRDWSDATTNGKDVAVYMQYNQEPLRAGLLLQKLRDTTLGKVSSELSRELTDQALRLLVDDTPEGSQRGVGLMDPWVTYLVNKGEYSDAYVYTVQTVKYYEAQAKQDEAIDFLKDKREVFLSKGQDQDANSLTDLMVRVYKTVGKVEEAATISLEWFEAVLDKRQWEQAFVSLTEASSIYQRKGDVKKAEELLQRGWDLFISEPEADEEAEELVGEFIKLQKNVYGIGEDKVMEIRHKAAYLALESSSIALANRLMTKVVATIKQSYPDQFYTTTTAFINKAMELELYKESQPYVSDLLSAYIHDIAYVRDLLFYYVDQFLKANQVEIATRLVELVLEQMKGSSGDVIRVTMRFVQMLAEFRLAETARSYIDRTVANLFPSQTPASAEPVGTIYQKFAWMVLGPSEELALEYAYKAADLFRKAGKFDKMVEVYLYLADNVSDPEIALRALKRGTFQAEQARLPQSQTLPLQQQLVFRALETKSPNADRDFVACLNQMEQGNQLAEAYDFLHESFFKMVRAGEFELFYKYIDYLLTLAQGLGKNTQHQKVAVQVAARYYRKRREKSKVTKLKEVYDSIKEPDPSSDDIAHFLKTGELPVEQPLVTPYAETDETRLARELAAEAAAKVGPSEEEEVSPDEVTHPPIMGEVSSGGFAEVGTDFDDLSAELGGDALSKALANALSQMSQEMGVDEEPVEEPKRRKVKRHITTDEEALLGELSGSLPQRAEDEEEPVAPGMEFMGQAMDTPDRGFAPRSGASAVDLTSFDSLSSLGDDDELAPPPGLSSSSGSLEDIFSSALSDLTNMFGSAGLDEPSEEAPSEPALPRSSAEPPEVTSPPEESPPSTSSGRKQLGSGSLTPREEQIYLELTREYYKVMKGKDYFKAVDEWTEVQKPLLVKWGITAEEWGRISDTGDSDDALQKHL